MSNKSTKSINIIQHNIGSIPYKFENILYDLSGYKHEGNKLKNKWDETNYRNIDKYLSTNNDLLSNMDILFLQEVQEGFQNKNYKKKIENKKTFFINYKKTGHLYYSNDNEEPESVMLIPHGCAVIINLNRFEIEKPKSEDKINTVNTRTSSWIILKDKLLGNLYATISVHGIIPNPLIQKYNKVENFFKRLIQEIEDLKIKYPNIIFIIGGDFNINLEKPNFDPYFDVKNDIHNYEKDIPWSDSYWNNSDEHNKEKDIPWNDSYWNNTDEHNNDNNYSNNNKKNDMSGGNKVDAKSGLEKIKNKLKDYKKLIQDFKNDLGKNNILLKSVGKYSNKDIENQIKFKFDFILISQNLDIRKPELLISYCDDTEKKKYGSKNKNFLVNDFDHSCIKIQFNNPNKVPTSGKISKIVKKKPLKKKI